MKNKKNHFPKKLSSLKVFVAFIYISVFQLAIFPTSNNSIAQTSYQPFFKDSVALFNGDINYIDDSNVNGFEWVSTYKKSKYKAAAFDSVVAVNGITTYYPFKTPRDTAENNLTCINLEGNAWIGNYFTHDTLSSYTFINQWNDPIKLHTKENNGFSWIFYTYENGSYLQATLSNTVYFNLGAFNDSIKTIQLSYFDSLGNSGINDWTQKEILLSKNYGIIKFPHINYFPDDTSMWTRKFEISIPNSYTIYNFNAGDQFYYKDYRIGQGQSPPLEATDYTLLEILNKNIDVINEQFIYTAKQTFFDYKNNFPNPDYLDTTIVTTITNTYSFNEIFGIPEKTVVDSLGKLTFNLMEQGYTNFYLNPAEPVFIKNVDVYQGFNTCYTLGITPLPKTSMYAKSLGRVLYKEEWNGGGSSHFTLINELIGFQKNGIIYGNFVGIQNLNKADEAILKIIENTSANLCIDWKGNKGATLHIYSTSGMLILEKYLTPGINNIAQSNLAAGLYFINAFYNNQFAVQKFIKN